MSMWPVSEGRPYFRKLRGVCFSSLVCGNPSIASCQWRDVSVCWALGFFSGRFVWWLMLGVLPRRCFECTWFGCKFEGGQAILAPLWLQPQGDLAVKSRSSWSQSPLPLTLIALLVSQRSGMPKQAGIEWSFAFCPAPPSGMNQDSSFQGCCACLVSAALTTANSASSLLPAASLVSGLQRSTGWASQYPSWFLAFPGAVQLWAGVSLPSPCSAH